MRLISSVRVLRLLFFTIFLAIVLLLLIGLQIPCWYGLVKHVENYVNLSSNNSHSHLQSEIEKTTEILNLTSSSATNLARILGSSLNDSSNLSLFDIENKVAPFLFQALLITPHLTQISYIGLEGLLFSYCTDRNHTFALYTNYSPLDKYNSASTNSSPNAWYTQMADRDTGKLYGDAVRLVNLSITVNPSLFQPALNSSNGYNFLGTGWNNAQDFMFINTASFNNGKGLISLGFLVKELVQYYASGVDLQGGYFSLATTNGKILVEGFENVRMVLMAESLISFELMKPNGEEVGCIGSVSCNPNGVTSSRASLLKIHGTNYMFSCSPLHIMGVQSVYILAIPQNGLLYIVHKSSRMALILIIFIIIIIVLSSFSVVYEISMDTLIEMYLRAQLIKQMEATQQAERKSMNKTRAFASASHDIRASLAGLIGWIRLSYNEVGYDSSLRTNLRQMEACTEDLLDILNSILDTSKIEEGKMQLKEEEFNMVQLLQDVVDLYRPVGAEKGVDVVLNLCDEDSIIEEFSYVKGDRGKLKQIFCNLLSNAVKFTSEGRVILRAWARKPSLDVENSVIASNKSSTLMRRLSHMFHKEKSTHEEEQLEAQNAVVKNDPDSVEFVFEVDDTGKGIPKEKQKDIFENYVQVKETALEQGGTGLGLGIVQSLVRLMHGEIEVVDKDIGERGSCFRFNVILSVCENKENQIDRLRIIAHGLDPSPKRKGSPSTTQIGKFSKSPGSSRNIDQQMTKVESEIQEVISSSSSGESPWKKRIRSPTSCYRFSSGYIKSKSPIHPHNYHQLQHEVAIVQREHGESSGQKFLSGKKILVVDDNLVQRTLAMKQISILGASVDVCTNGKDAVELVCNGLTNPREEKEEEEEEVGEEEEVTRSLPYDYILMDCEMSIMSGYETTSEIRKAEKSYGVHIPIIGFSAHSIDSEEANKTIEAGMDAYLSKPLVPELLLEAIKEIYDKR